MALSKELEREGKRVADWLNNGNPNVSFPLQQVTGLLVTMLAAERETDATKLEGLLGPITVRLSKYTSQMWPEAIGAEHRWNITRTPSLNSKIDPAEFRAVTTIVGIAEAGYLANFITCDWSECGRWIFKVATRPNQRFCGSGRRCKQNWFEANKAGERNKRRQKNGEYKAKIRERKKRRERKQRQEERQRLEEILRRTAKGRKKNANLQKG